MVEQMEDRTVPSTLTVISESGSSGYSFSGTFTYWNGTLLEVSGANTQPFPSGSGFYNPNYATGGAAVGYEVHNQGGNSYWLQGSGGLEILPNPDGPNTFSGTAFANGTVNLRIDPGPGEQIGDPVYVDVEIESAVTGGGTATPTLSPFNGSGRNVAYIGDTISASVDVDVDLIGSQPVSASAAITVKYTLAGPAPRPNISLDRVVHPDPEGGIGFDYTIHNTPLGRPVLIKLYWSTSNDHTGIIKEISAGWLSETQLGSYHGRIPHIVTGSGAGAKYIVAVADVGDTIRETNEDDNIAAVELSHLRLAGFDVQKGRTQRSFVRYLDLTFASSSGVADLISGGRVKLLRHDLDGNFIGLVSLSGVLSSSGNTLSFDFGAQGIGGNRNSNAGDGWYQIQLDLDGDGSFETTRSFYRLVGDVNGDRQVTSTYATLIKAAYTTSATAYNAERDVNGDGIVNALDWTYASRALNRKLKDGLAIDD
jgi:hypothetical protein